MKLINLSVLGLSLFWLTACDSKITGNEGNFVFSYAADDEIRNFNKPIAVGAKLDIFVKEVGTSAKKVNINSASFDDEAILTVEGTSGNKITVKGMGVGNALLSVEGAAAGSETLTDSINLQAKVPDVLKINHTCATSTNPEVAYLTNQRILVPFELEMENSQPVIGYGYYPITLPADSGLSHDTSIKAVQFLYLDTPSTMGETIISSTIDSTTLAFSFVSASSIDGLLTNASTLTLRVSAKTPLMITPSSGGKPICQSQASVSVTSQTPETCAPTLESESSETTPFSRWASIDGLAEGSCTLRLNFVDSGYSEDVTFDVLAP